MGKTIVITAGGTSEPIDSVRTITNSSTGKLGVEICAALLSKKEAEIDKIFYICSSRSAKPPASEKVETVYIGGTADLAEKTLKLLAENKVDIFIHSMAVSDYTTDYVSSASLLSSEIADKIEGLAESGGDLREKIEEVLRSSSAVIGTGKKISSSEDNLIIKLKPTPKVISMIKPASPKTFLVGFKLLSGVSEKELYDTAFGLLKKNRCDLVVANDLAEIRGGRHKAMLIRPDGRFVRADSKAEIAEKIIEETF